MKTVKETSLSSLETAIVAEIHLRRTYEKAKTSGIHFVVRTLPKIGRDVAKPVYKVLVQKINEFDEARKQDMPCDASIMCLREYKRHKVKCPLNSNYRESCPKGEQFSCKTIHKKTATPNSTSRQNRLSWAK
jgi:hypothetical protein